MNQARIEVRYVRMLSRDDSATSEFLGETYSEGWRVVHMALDDGMPHFLLERMILDIKQPPPPAGFNAE